MTNYCTSYEWLFTYKLRVVIDCASYELLFKHEVRVTIYCRRYFFKSFCFAYHWPVFYMKKYKCNLFIQKHKNSMYEKHVGLFTFWQQQDGGKNNNMKEKCHGLLLAKYTAVKQFFVSLNQANTLLKFFYREDDSSL